MKTITLNSREIIYLAARTGGSELMGIPDGFVGMEDLEIQQELLKIENDLSNRGYMETDFDGNSNINDDVARLVKACTACEKFISADKVKAGQPYGSLLFYVYGNDIVQVFEKKEDQYTLTLVKDLDINNAVVDYIDWIDEKTTPVGDKVTVPQRLIAQLQNNYGQAELKSPKEISELCKAGCSEGQAQIIVDGLRGAANYYDIVIIDLTNEENDMMSILAINTANGSLELIPTHREEEETIEFTSINHDQFRGKLSKSLNTIGIKESSGGFE